VKSTRKREIFVSHGAGAENFQVMARSMGSARGDKSLAHLLPRVSNLFLHEQSSRDQRLSSAAGPVPHICRRDQGRRRSSASSPPSGPGSPLDQHVSASPLPRLRRSFSSSAWPPSPGPCHPLLLLCCIHKVSSSSPLLHLLQLGELRMCKL
jgi:hypothetical protein